MTIKPPPAMWQPSLLDVLPDKPISRSGEARTRYGECVNLAVNALLGLTDIPNSGSYDCVFDAYHKPSSTFCEVKSLRVKNKIPVYRWRIEKDKAAGVPLVYIIGVHDVRGAASMGDMWRQMADTLNTILVLPAARIEELALAEPLQKIQSEAPRGERNGYRRKGYCEGYHNIPWSKLDDGMQDGRLHGAEVHGLPFTANVFFHQTITPWL